MIMPVSLEASIRSGAHTASAELLKMIKSKPKGKHKLNIDMIQNIIMIAMHAAPDYGKSNVILETKF